VTLEMCLAYFRDVSFSNTERKMGYTTAAFRGFSRFLQVNSVLLYIKIGHKHYHHVRFQVFTAASMKFRSLLGCSARVGSVFLGGFVFCGWGGG
jgi:hypothetical protein